MFLNPDALSSPAQPCRQRGTQMLRSKCLSASATSRTLTDCGKGGLGGLGCRMQTIGTSGHLPVLSYTDTLQRTYCEGPFTANCPCSAPQIGSI